MTSPFVRRRRLAAELRALREERGMTADELARLLHQSRMKISKLENARIRPDVADVMKILDILRVSGEKWLEIVTIAREAAERGWWDAYGDAMGDRQRMYADIESGASAIRGYNQISVPGVLQTPEFTWALVDLDRAGFPLSYKPERMGEARLQRQKVVLGTEGPVYELILDEFVMRRLAVPPKVMSGQLRHLMEIISLNPRITLHVLPIDARVEGGFPAGSTFSIYTFRDPDDPPMAIAETVRTDVVYNDAAEVMRYEDLYRRLRAASLSAVSSLTLLEETADRLSDLTES